MTSHQVCHITYTRCPLQQIRVSTKSTKTVFKQYVLEVFMWGIADIDAHLAARAVGCSNTVFSVLCA